MKILTAFFRNDYGDPKRGPSGESLVLLPAFLAAGFETVAFFFEDNGFPLDPPRLQEKLLEAVAHHRPDYVFFILMENEVWPTTLDEIGRMATTVNWFCDDQWRFEDFTSRVAPHLGLSLTVDKYCQQKYQDRGIGPVKLVHWWPLGEVVDLPVETTDYEFDVSFIGAKNSTREWVVTELEAAGISVACFGHGWPLGKVTFERMKEIFLKSKINLNLSNSIPMERSYYDFWLARRLAETKSVLWKTRHPIKKWKLWREIQGLRSGKTMPYSAKNQEQVKGRNFEIAGCGGFQLSKMAIGLEAFFSIGSEIMVYNTVDELKLLIHYYLKNEDERKSMARRAMERARTYQLTDQLRALFGGTGS